MPHFDIIKKIDIKKKSFRVASLYDQFDLQSDSLNERFTGDINLPEEWNIGVIVGRSGTGKSTIAKELFGDFAVFEYKENHVIDDFPKDISNGDVFTTLSSVGFSTPPSWLKPYSVLSNGEKMRVDLARSILQNKDIIIFDEFTSVVDREIAKIGSFAVQKAIRKANKRFIAVSCHYDIIDWLEPDWVFCTDDMTFTETRGRRRRPEIRMQIVETTDMWKHFSKYHYLNHSSARGAKEFVAIIDNIAVGFISWIHFPYPGKSMKKVHRLVILPDYQGIGIGQVLLNTTAKYMQGKCEHVGITTSLKGFAKGLMKNKNWVFINGGMHSKNKNLKTLNKTVANTRNVYSFRYIGGV